MTLSVNSNKKVNIRIGIHEVAITKREKLLRVHPENEFSFDYIMYQRFAKKDVVKFVKKSTLINSFSKSQFNYCPLV